MRPTITHGTWKHLSARGLLVILALSPAALVAQEPVDLPRQPGWVGAVAFAPDSRTLAIGAGDGSVTLWDLSRREKLASLTRHNDAVAALAWSPDGGLLASGGHDHAAILHKVGQGEKAAGEHRLLKGHSGAVMAAAFSPDGKRFFTGSIDATIREWQIGDASTSKVVRGHMSWVNGLAVDRAGARLASASSDNSVQLRDLKTMEKHAYFRVKDGEIRSVAFAPDGQWLAAGVRYGSVFVERQGSAQDEVVQFKAHAGETWAVAFTPDGKLLASGGGDWNVPGEVRLWDVGTWKERATLKHTGEVLCLSISPDGRWLAAGGWDRNVRVWDLTNLPKSSKRSRRL